MFTVYNVCVLQKETVFFLHVNHMSCIKVFITVYSVMLRLECFYTYFIFSQVIQSYSGGSESQPVWSAPSICVTPHRHSVTALKEKCVFQHVALTQTVLHTYAYPQF